MHVRPRNFIFVILGIVLVALLILILKPIPIPNEEDCLTLEGVVLEIYDGGNKDIIFKLKGHEQLFYVNRGLTKGLDLRQINEQLINKSITIKYPKYWSPLDPTNSIRHISKIEYHSQVVFNELN